MRWFPYLLDCEAMEDQLLTYVGPFYREYILHLEIAQAMGGVREAQPPHTWTTCFVPRLGKGSTAGVSRT